MPRFAQRDSLLALGALVSLAGGCTLQPSAAVPAASSTAAPSTEATAAASGAASAREVRRYGAQAFYSTISYGLSAGHAWSPDGRELLVHSDESGIFNAYALAAEDGTRRALTGSTTDSTYAVSWFPQDRRVLVQADQSGNELTHLFVREVTGGLRDLTPGARVKALFGGWSSDGKFLFVFTNERDPRSFDLYRYAARDYERTLLYKNEQIFTIGAVAPDGRHAALIQSRSSADSNLYLLALDKPGAQPVPITPHTGDALHGAYEFTPDGRQLVYSTDAHGEYQQAWSYDIASGARALLLQADWDVSSVAFSASGRYRVWTTNEDARTVVRVADLRSGAQLALPPLPPGDLSQLRFSRDERRLALLLSSDTSPADVYTLDLEALRSQRLTHALTDPIRESDLVDAQVVRYPSFDGLPIPSILYRPHSASAAQRVPALVWVHGGPGGQSRTGYSAVIQHLVNHGYAVLAVNNRGSSGYGKTFVHMDDRRHGEVDLQDLVYAKRYLASLDWVEGERIGVIGGSYGGFLVGAALAFEPDVFAAGIDIFGVMNWVRTLGNIPPWWAAFKESLYSEMGDPATDAERHRRISPLFHAQRIRAPLLVVQGANDPRVLQQESDEIVAAVRANGIPVEYLLFPDEGHGFSKRANRIAASDAYVRFLDAHLHGRSSATPAVGALLRGPRR